MFYQELKTGPAVHKLTVSSSIVNVLVTRMSEGFGYFLRGDDFCSSGLYDDDVVLPSKNQVNWVSLV